MQCSGNTRIVTLRFAAKYIRGLFMLGIMSNIAFSEVLTSLFNPFKLKSQLHYWRRL